ncbi:MAG: 50S ribosomal protein L24, partial [Balneolales bacterium]
KKLHVKKNDQVEVLTGNDRGKRGKILMVFPEKERVLVEGINMRTKHQKPTQENPQGGRSQQEMPIHVSNVLPIDPTTDEPSRIGRKRITESGKERWVRFAKVSGETLDK